MNKRTAISIKSQALIILLIVLMSSFVFTGCGTSEQDKSRIEDLEKQLTESMSKAEKYKSEVDEYKSKTKAAESELKTLKSELNDKTKELNKLKKDMEPYINLSVEEAEARKHELEEARKIREAEKAEREAEEKAAKEAEQAAIEQAKKEEEARGYETGITYDQLARTPDDYIAKKVKFYGKIIQVLEGDNTNNYRFAVEGDYNSIILLEASKSLTKNNRILEDDYVTIHGSSFGLYTYKSTMGGSITVPLVLVDEFIQ